ncbi:MAG: hypothetical protein AAGG06_18485 [Pseudomonadota bacterium]
MPAQAEDAMTLDRLGEIITGIDPEAQAGGTAFQMTVEDVPIFVVTDPNQDRMRAMTPIRSADGLSEAELQRMMQANFDSALDARYAIAQGRLWSVFIHPLGALEKNQFLSGIGQVVNLAVTYGGLYTSGELTFGGGDSRELQRRALIDELIQKGEDI